MTALPLSAEETELRAAIDRVLRSPSRKKLVVAGPGTGKTTLFKELLQVAGGGRDNRLVLTFINNLKDDLEFRLKDLARVSTLHSYCLGLLYQSTSLRRGLSADFRVTPGLASLIHADWQYLRKGTPPQFVGEMRRLGDKDHIAFYLLRGDYYDAVDFDDTVYRTYQQLSIHPEVVPAYELLLIDEYQDFNALEDAFIDIMAERSPVVIAGDDDQALYSQLRDASWDHIRSKHHDGTFEVFELPFCMRCPKVIVDAVNDVIGRAQLLRKLQGRIPKPYRHFPPAKAVDSERYPTIAVVYTSVQSKNANYMGQYIAQAISSISTEEREAAAAEGFPAILVIVARPYREQIIHYLATHGHAIESKRPAEEVLTRTAGLLLLKTNPTSNLGWRIVLEGEPRGFAAPIIEGTERGAQLEALLPAEYRERVLNEAAAYVAPTGGSGAAESAEASPDLGVRVTSFEGAKGLSAQHVFIAGMHDGEVPRNPRAIKDIEICRFVVGLTRTRKHCTLLATGRFAGKRKTPSVFLSWIDRGRLADVRVNAQYWSVRKTV